MAIERGRAAVDRASDRLPSQCGVALVTTSEPPLFGSPFILTQLEQQRFRERLSIEHAFFDRR